MNQTENKFSLLEKWRHVNGFTKRQAAEHLGYVERTYFYWSKHPDKIPLAVERYCTIDFQKKLPEWLPKF